MTVKTEAYQVGVSGTASQNFHLTAAAADGSMQLYRGNPGAPIGAALLNVSAAGVITYPGDGAWVAGTPISVTSGSGALSNASATFNYRKIGRVLHYRMSVSIIANGTGASTIKLRVAGLNALVESYGFGREGGVTGQAVYSVTANSGSDIDFIIFKMDQTYPGGNGYILNLSGTLETPT